MPPTLSGHRVGRLTVGLDKRHCLHWVQHNVYLECMYDTSGIQSLIIASVSSSAKKIKLMPMISYIIHIPDVMLLALSVVSIKKIIKLIYKINLQGDKFGCIITNQTTLIHLENLVLLLPIGSDFKILVSPRKL